MDFNRVKIYPNVQLGKNIQFGEYCIVGTPNKTISGSKNKTNTVIGDNAIIRSHTVIYASNTIGKNLNTGHHVVIRESNEIGNNVSIGTVTCVEHHVIIEDNVRIHSQAFIPEFTILRKNCWIGPNVVITNAKYPTSNGVKENLKGAVIEEGAIIGANVTLLPNIVIGRFALIGAGSVVTKDIPERSVAVGNPAHIISSIDQIQEYETIVEN